MHFKAKNTLKNNHFQTPLVSLINYWYESILFDGVKFDYIHEQDLANYLG